MSLRHRCTQITAWYEKTNKQPNRLVNRYKLERGC